MATRTLEIQFIGDAKPVTKAFEDVGDSGGKLTAKLSGVGSAFGHVASTAAGLLSANVLGALPGALMGASDRARDLELQMKKAETVFGENIGIVNKWASANAAAMGMSKAQVTNLAAGLQDLLVPMGFTRDEATALSTKTLGLAGALSEWSGGAKSAAEVSDILTKAYLGETDGLKALGISISAADVQARLHEKHQDKLTGTALQQASALAIQELAFEKSTDAQKAFAEGAGSAARKQAEMHAKIEELKDKLSLTLAPAISTVTGLLADVMIPVLGFVGDGFSTVAGVAGSFAKYLGFAVTEGDAANDFLADMPGFLQPVAQFLGEVAIKAREFVELGWEKLQQAGEWLAGIAVAAFELAKVEVPKFITALDDWVKGETGKSIVENLKDIQKYLGDGDARGKDFAGAWESIGNALKPAIDLLRPLAQELLVSMRDATRDVVKALGDLWEALKPLQPVIKPLAEIIGTVLVLAVAAILIQLRLFVEFVATVLVVTIEGLALTIRGITAAFEYVTEKLKAWGPEIGAAFLGVYNTISANVELIVDTVKEVLDFGQAMFDIGKSLITSFFAGIVDEFERGIGKVKELLDPRNWDIPGRSPLLEAMEHTGQDAGKMLVRGIVHGIVTEAPALSAVMTPFVAQFAQGSPFVDVNTGNAVPDYVLKNSPYLKKLLENPTALLDANGELPGGVDWDWTPGKGWGPATRVTEAAIPGSQWPNGGPGWVGGGGGTQIIQLVVDGAVLAEVVNRENGRGY